MKFSTEKQNSLSCLKCRKHLPFCSSDPYNVANAGDAVLNVADPYVVVGDVQVELYGNKQNPEAKV